MAKVTLKATLKKSEDALGAQMIIDMEGVGFDMEGNSHPDPKVEPGDHVVTVFVQGPKGAKAAFSIKQGGDELIADTVEVTSGNTGVGTGPFSTK